MKKEKNILLYGLSAGKYEFFNKVKGEEIDLGEREFQIDKKLPTFVSYKSYSISTYINEFARILFDEKENLKTPEQWQQFSQDWPKYISMSHKNLPLWKEYYRCMKITAETKENYINNLTKQGCKNGINMAIANPNIMIYFVLDKLNMNFVTDKAKKFKSSYTGIELRYIYRHWSEAKESIVFFEKNKEVKAPWIKGKYIDAWERYANKRAYRLLGKKIRKAIEEREARAFQELNESILQHRPTHEYMDKEEKYWELSKLIAKTSEVHPKKIQNTQVSTFQKNKEKGFRSFKTLREFGNKKATVNNCKKKQLEYYFELSI
ncbi:hypothetical protein A5844_002211 [Enterococcus sp. 10A9_DIV0425]|uniref:Uncharacterized protein n=1 Tax=Candidatus Enterococcus wittei TaxID=1987383 RepID=A0A242JXL0_9ENTE|nr:hypothetical protein [Enterococcus sp. 10A9_DIV0425]OTP09433.1 hypothetical protein A5844_002211 [Enterococcus sp. 10A9_DIV0425]THE09585.1 hypothetical protein E1H99_10835 [Enterococcus hirae]